MQADLASWPTDVRGLALRPMRRHWEPDARSNAHQRCQRCDIPLGSSLCPNPECREPHGQRVGDLCTWCYHNAEERADGIDCPPLSHRVCHSKFVGTLTELSPEGAAHVEGERPMGSMDDIRAACERTASTLSARPAIGQHTFVTRVRVQDGLTCDIEEGPWHLTADLPHQLGGQAAGPTPGMFGRAALGSCLAICYVMWAARLGVPLTSVAVEVHADTDTRGLLGIAEVPAGYTDIRYVVSLTSPAPPADIIRVLDTAEGHSPYMDVFKHPHALRRIVHIATPAEETP